MNAVGIDVSKGRSMVAIMQPLGVVVAKPYTIRHTASELEELAYSLKSLDGETRVIMEHTGRYYEPIAQALHELGVFVSAVNPILINEYGNNSVRRVKTDKKDAVKIARYGLDNWAELREYTPMDAARQKLQIFNRQRHFSMHNKVAMKNNLIALLDQTFPGVNKLFSSPARDDGSEKWVDFAYTFWHCDCIADVSERAFTERYQKWCKRHGYCFTPAKAADLYISALGHFTTLPKNQNTKLLIHQAIDQLKAVSAAIAVTTAEMQRLAQSLPEYHIVRSMYGVGDIIAPQLIAEIGDVRRFHSRGAIVAYAGIDPSSNQSGDYESKSNRVTKRGSSYLRKTLFLIMDVLIRTSPADDKVFQFMDKKRAEGKPYFVYMTAGCNKFLRIYYGRVKEYLNSLDIESLEDIEG